MHNFCDQRSQDKDTVAWVSATMPTTAEIAHWTPAEVGAYVASLGKALEGYEQTMVDNGVDGALFLELGTAELEDMGMGALHRKKILGELAKIAASEGGDDGSSGGNVSGRPGDNFPRVGSRFELGASADSGRPGEHACAD